MCEYVDMDKIDILERLTFSYAHYPKYNSLSIDFILLEIYVNEQINEKDS